MASEGNRQLEKRIAPGRSVFISTPLPPPSCELAPPKKSFATLILVVCFCYFFYVSFHNPVLFVFRRLFHVCTFFLFFFNIFLGVVSCLKRIFIGAILGVMFLGRTQKSVLSRDFELKDPGLCKIFRSLFRKNIDY